MYQGQTGFASIRTDFAPDIAVPGPLYIHAAIGNTLAPPPTDCVANPVQSGCGRLAVNTRPPSAAYLRFNDPDAQHSPAYFTIGQDNGPVVATSAISAWRGCECHRADQTSARLAYTNLFQFRP